MSFCRSAAKALCTRIAVASAVLLLVRPMPARPAQPSATSGGSAPGAPMRSNDSRQEVRPAPEPTTAPPQDSAPSTRELDEAREHFETALKSYSEGRYRAAIGELEKARRLDPSGKDLVYNLALVHEKLGELAAALAYFEQYLAMERDVDERARTEASIVRLRGALREAEREAEATSVLTVPPPQPLAASEAQPGVLDAWVWASGGLAVTALVVGAVLGARALTLEPGRGDATGDGRSVDDVRDDSQRAHQSAVAADIAFAVSLTSGAAAGLLYFGRVLPEPDARPAESPRPAQARIDIGVQF